MLAAWRIDTTTVDDSEVLTLGRAMDVGHVRKLHSGGDCGYEARFLLPDGGRADTYRGGRQGCKSWLEERTRSWLSRAGALSEANLEVVR